MMMLINLNTHLLIVLAEPPHQDSWALFTIPNKIIIHVIRMRFYFSLITAVSLAAVPRLFCRWPFVVNRGRRHGFKRRPSKEKFLQRAFVNPGPSVEPL